LTSGVPRWGASFGGMRIDLTIRYTSPTSEIAIATYGQNSSLDFHPTRKRIAKWFRVKGS